LAASGTTILGGGSQTDLGVTVATVLFWGTETVSRRCQQHCLLSGGSLVVFFHGLADPATICGGLAWRQTDDRSADRGPGLR
jgi:hypothetical protein